MTKSGRVLIAILLVLVTFSGVYAYKPYNADFVVAKDGSGDFTTVQAAINAVPDFRKKRTVIYIKDGTYKEKLILPSSKTNVTFIGEDVKKTILTYDDYASKKNRFGEEMGTTGSSSFFVFGNRFKAQNITFQNSSGPVGQAVAIRVDGDQAVFINCRFLGNQDTLYTHGRNSRQYYKNCYIEGTVDFIFGWSTVVFDNCTINAKTNGYITAASTPEDSDFGYVFKNCRISGDASANTYYLGRPWRDYANVVYLNCYLGKQIKPAGWSNWHGTDRDKTAYYAEYKNHGPGFKPRERVKWSHQLTKEQVGKYTLKNVFDGWIPTDAIQK